MGAASDLAGSATDLAGSALDSAGSVQGSVGDSMDSIGTFWGSILDSVSSAKDQVKAEKVGLDPGHGRTARVWCRRLTCEEVGAFGGRPRHASGLWSPRDILCPSPGSSGSWIY